MSDAVPAGGAPSSAPPVLCRGIQHPKLNAFTPGGTDNPECLGRYSYNTRSGWHSRACLFLAESNGGKKQCKKCKHDYSNIRKDRLPDLWPEEKGASARPAEAEAEEEAPSASDLVLSDEHAVRRLLLERIAAVGTNILGIDISCDTCSEMAVIANAMRVKGQHSFVLCSERVFTVCDGAGCESFRVRKHHGLAGTSCKNCIGKKCNDKRYGERREKHAEMRTAPTSKVNHRFLSTEETSERVKAVHDARQWTKIRLERALAKAQRLENKAVLSEAMLKHTEKAMEELATKKEAQDGLWDMLYGELKKLEAKGAYSEKEPLTKQSCKRFIDEWVMHAKNWVHVQRGRPTAVSYIPSFIGPAMAQYLRSPASQRQFREDSCLIQPSASYLQKLKAGQHCSDGFNVECAVIQPTYRGTGTTEHGQIAWDEMKVTKGVLVNVKDNSVRGITKDFYDIGKIVTNLLDEDDIDEAEEPAVHVNQYCYRSTSGRVFNIMSFFNNGSLSANVAMRQLFLVVMCCEMVGSKVFGLICDAGGSFQRMFRYLGKKAALPEGVAWISEDLVRCRNPYDRSRWIYFFHCATHNCKNKRTRIWDSIENSQKMLLDAEGFFIGKFLWVAAWLRDEQRAAKGGMRETLLRQAAIELDKWSKMSAKWAKAPFAWKTLIEIMQHLYLQLRVARHEMYRVENHPTGKLGYLSAAARHMKRLLKEKDPTNQNLMCQISSFELGANVSELYNQRALNMQELITHDKIDLYETQVKQNLEYFVALRTAAIARRATGARNWDGGCFHIDTHTIMLRSFRGYFGYCRYLIDYARRTPQDRLPPGMNQLFAVTAAHLNTSFVEGWFSLVRLMGLDEAIKYISAVANRLMSQGIKEALKQNPMYDEEDVGAIVDEVPLGPQQLSKLHEAKRKVRDGLVQMFISRNQPYAAPAPAFGAAIAVDELTASTDVSELMSALRTSCASEQTTPVGAAAVVTEGESSSEGSALNSSMEESDADSPAKASAGRIVGTAAPSSSGSRGDGAVDLAEKKSAADLLGSPSAEDITTSTPRKRATAERSPQKSGHTPPAKKTPRAGGGSDGAGNGRAAASAAATSTALQPVRNPYVKAAPAPPQPKWSEATIQRVAKWDAHQEALKKGAGGTGAGGDDGAGDGEDDLPPPPPPTGDEMAKAVLEKLRGKKLRDGYAAYLMEHEHFGTWIHVAQEDRAVKAWFNSFLNDTVDRATSRVFDEACRLIMGQLLQFGENALLKRRSTAVDSYEMSVWHYLVSDEFVLICSKMLPTETMRTVPAGWAILGNTLAEILRNWIIDAVRIERRKRDPEKFRKKLNVSLSDEELKSEANRILGWAVVSARSNLKKEEKDTDEYRLLSSMVCLEKDVDGDYMRTMYDLTTMLRNMGGDGGLSLVSADFFEWGKKLMRKVSKELTVEDIAQKGDKEFDRAKKAILGDPELKSDFVLVCNRQNALESRGRTGNDDAAKRYNLTTGVALANGNGLQSAALLVASAGGQPPQPSAAAAAQPVVAHATTKTVEYKLALKVFTDVVTKVCNARFGEVMKNYCDEKKLSSQGKVNFRSMLLTMENMGSRGAEAGATSGKPGPAPTSKSNEASASSSTLAVAAAPPAPRFAIMAPGANGAVGATHLKSKSFVIAGAFPEVHAVVDVAQQQLGEMIESFGGKVQQRQSKNMTHLLAGKDLGGKKVDDAVAKGAKIMNLRRLQKLLLGQLTFESMDALDNLNKESFRGDAYQPAGTPPLPQLPPATTANATTTTTTSTAATAAMSTQTQSTNRTDYV